MTWNIANGLVVPERLGLVLASSDMDVIGLQEVSPDQKEALLRATEASHPYRILSGAGFHGRGLLSRFPIRDHRWLDASEGRPDLLVTLDTPNGDLTIVVGHPMPPRIGRSGVVFDSGSQKQITGFADVLTVSRPGLLLADLNMTMRNPLHARLQQGGLIDAHLTVGAGAGKTFPVRPGQMRSFSHPFSKVPLPAIARIDYIWHTSEIVADSVWVGDAMGSDHRPVLARLSIVLPADETGAS